MKLVTSCALVALTLAVGATDALAATAVFGSKLSQNTTGLADSLFLGAPNGDSSNGGVNWAGIGGQILTFDFENIRIVNGAGGDFNIYEVDFGASEFNAISVAVSEDGTNFFTLANSAPSRVAIVPVDNDPGHTDNSFAQAYDIAASGFTAVRIEIQRGETAASKGRGVESRGENMPIEGVGQHIGPEATQESMGREFRRRQQFDGRRAVQQRAALDGMQCQSERAPGIGRDAGRDHIPTAIELVV